MSRAIIAYLVLMLIALSIFYIIMRFVRPGLSRVYKWKINLHVGAVYLAILLLSIPLLLVLDQNEFFAPHSAQAQGLLREAPDNWAEGYQEIERNKRQLPNVEEGLLRNSHQTFELREAKLEVKEKSNYGRISLERKESADGIIEVSTYIAPHYAGINAFSPAIEFTKLVKPPEITLEGGVLRIEAPPTQTLVFKYFNDNFTVNQFKGIDQDSFGIGGGMRFGEKEILIRVPADVEVVLP